MRHSDRLHNRDLSWLGFNERVLMEAADPTLPVMERFRFLSIFSSNLDEFFRVRYPIVNVYQHLNDKELKRIFPPPDREIVNQAQQIIDKQLASFGNILTQQLLPALEQENIILYYNRPIPTYLEADLAEYFFSQILSFLRPVFLRNSLRDDFDAESNRLYLAVKLSQDGHDTYQYAFLNIPSKQAGRFFCVRAGGRQHIFFIDDIIRHYLYRVFSGYKVAEVYSFKITRDADLNLDEENMKGSILAAIEQRLDVRDKGRPSRLLYQQNMPFTLLQLISSAFNLQEQQLFSGGAYHNLSDLADLPIQESQLNFKRLEPHKHKSLHSGVSLLNTILEEDILLHFPYQSYAPVLTLFNEAAIDPGVTSIYVTLYRIASHSHIANALISAAANGKEVVVFVELKARFDEANNIKWSKEMKKAGIKILYSLPGIKVHSKIALITRDIDGQTRRSAFIGTGNFNETTARFYTDHALLTSHTGITEDLNNLFDTLRKQDKHALADATFQHILVARNNMVPLLNNAIEHQMERAASGLSSCIRIKVNNLEDPLMIEQLYKASAAGVKVQLLVRSICCIVPGREGLSDNIQVRRIVDRFLEHSRLFIFGCDTDGNDVSVYMGSADLMNRNLYRRIEVITPVYDLTAQEQLVEYFNLQWNDNVKGHLLDEALKPYRADNSATEKKSSSQQAIYSYLKQQHAQQH